MLSELRRNLGFAKQLWRSKRAIRNLLESKEQIFIADFPPGHFYSPIPALADALAECDSARKSAADSIHSIDLNDHGQKSRLQTFAPHYSDLPFPDKPKDGFRYYLDNPFFCYGDGIVLYSFLRQLKPRRIVEIGSGFSSAAMLDTADRFSNGSTEFTFIEPFPERLLGLLTSEDNKRCRIEAKGVQQVSYGLFECLEENDILFIDSSHVGKAASDVLHILFEILPRLRKGVVIHFHDIVWPFEYPRVWYEGGRAWNEAYFLRSFLQYNQVFEVLFFNSYMEVHHAEAIRAVMPKMLQSPSSNDTIGNSSLWLRKVA